MSRFVNCILRSGRSGPSAVPVQGISPVANRWTKWENMCESPHGFSSAKKSQNLTLPETNILLIEEILQNLGGTKPSKTWK